MLIYSNTVEGFDNIYTHEHPPTEDENISPPVNKPYIILTMPLEENREYYNNDILNSYRSLSITSLDLEPQQEKIILTITGTKNIRRAIEWLKNDERYNQDQNNQGVLTYLNELYENLGKALKPVRISEKSKTLKGYNKIKLLPQNSMHEAIIVESPEKQQYVFKKDYSGRKISEIEAYNAFVGQVFLGKSRVPKIRPAVDEKNNRIGTLSKVIEGFTDFENYYDQHQQFPSHKELIEKGLIRAMAVAYCLAENDFRLGNLAFNKNGEICLFDFGQTAYPMNAKYMGVDPEQENGETPGKVTYKEAFNLSQEGILYFPHPKRTYPKHWVGRRNPNTPENEISYEELINLQNVENDPEAIHDKFIQFLKFAAMEKELFTRTAALFISNPTAAEKKSSYFEERSEQMREFLLDNQQFFSYLKENPQICNAIIQDLEAFNEGKKENSPLRVNIDAVKNNLSEIIFAVHEKEINMLSFFYMKNIAGVIAYANQLLTQEIGYYCIDEENQFNELSNYLTKQKTAIKIAESKINAIRQRVLNLRLNFSLYTSLNEENFYGIFESHFKKLDECMTGLNQLFNALEKIENRMKNLAKANSLKTNPLYTSLKENFAVSNKTLFTLSENMDKHLTQWKAEIDTLKTKTDDLCAACNEISYAMSEIISNHNNYRSNLTELKVECETAYFQQIPSLKEIDVFIKQIVCACEEFSRFQTIFLQERDKPLPEHGDIANLFAIYSKVIINDLEERMKELENLKITFSDFLNQAKAMISDSEELEERVRGMRAIVTPARQPAPVSFYQPFPKRKREEEENVSSPPPKHPERIEGNSVRKRLRF